MMNCTYLLGFYCALSIGAFVGAKVHLLDRCGDTIYVSDYDYYTVDIDGDDWPLSLDECIVTFKALDVFDDVFYKMEDIDIDDRDIKLILESSSFDISYSNEATYQKADSTSKSKRQIRTNTYLRVRVVRNDGSLSNDIDVKLYIYNDDYSSVTTGGVVGIVFGCIGFVVVVVVVIAVVCAAKKSRAVRGQVIRQTNQVNQATTITMATYPATAAYPGQNNTAVFAAGGYGMTPPQAYGYPGQVQYPVQPVGPYPVQGVGAYPAQQGSGVVGNLAQPTHVALPPGAPPQTTNLDDVPSYPPPKYQEKY